MKNFFVMDIETYQKDNSVIPYTLVLKTDSTIKHSYGDKDKIMADFLNNIENEGLRSNFKSVEVFTHNINFDGFLIIEYFLKKGIPFKWFIRNLNLYFIDFTYKGFSIKIRCSYKILGTSVKNLGEMLKIYKQPFPYKFMNDKNIYYIGKAPSVEYFENENDYYDFIKIWGTDISIKDISISYCVNDADIVYKSLKNIFSLSDKRILKKSFSFSSYSYKLFIKNYDTEKISNIRISNPARDYIDNSYFGGRTEIFGNLDNGIIHRFDFPGMYGSCMLETFPVGEPVFSNPKDFSKPGFYSVSVESNLKIPILPMRSENKKIIYPNGQFTTCLPRDEFVLFIEKGGKILKIHSALTYENEKYVFKKFVNDFELLKSAGGFYKLYGKQVINSLYGSFALRKDTLKYYILYDINELDSLKKENRLVSFIDFGKIIIAGVEGEVDNNREKRNLAYSSFISSKARIKLHKNVYAVDDKYSLEFGDKYKLLYLETDSIDISIPENRLNEKIMDVSWQKVYSDGVYISPKFYSLKELDKPKIKGIRKSDYNFEELKKMFYDSSTEKIMFKNQLQFTKKNFSIKQDYISKILNLKKYDKRIFSEDKLNTKPIIIKEPGLYRYNENKDDNWRTRI